MLLYFELYSRNIGEMKYFAIVKSGKYHDDARMINLWHRVIIGAKVLSSGH